MNSADGVWIIDADRVGVIPKSATEWLDEGERAKLERMQDARARRQYLISRIAVRGLLAQATGLAPGELHFDTSGEERGKPRLITSGHCEGAPAFPAFNVAHAGDAVVIAISSERELGVDIEPLSGMRGLDPRAFLRDEERALLPESCEDEDDGEVRERALLELWTRKEAYAKLRGRGFETDPREIRLPGAESEVEMEYRELNLGGRSYGLALAHARQGRSSWDTKPFRVPSSLGAFADSRPVMSTFA